MLQTPKLALRLSLALLFFFALDALAFRTGWYAEHLSPDSTAGYLQNFLWIERHRVAAHAPQVLAVGDSRMGLKARVANALTSQTGFAFGNIAVPGTTPRCWYYMLREVDPAADRYAAIVIGLDSYDDYGFEDMNDRELDINYLTPLLGFRDLVPFLASYESWPQRIHAAESILFKGLAYQHDVQDFLARPRGRLQVARLQRETGASAIYDAVWERRSLAGMSVDWAARKVQLPAWADTRNRELAEGWLLREPHWHFEELATYRRRWLGAILDRYRGTRTKVIFLRLPRGPVVRPDLPAPDPASSIRELGARRPALLMDERTFDLLERPELFGDAMHLNEAGGTEFSQIAAREVGRMLGEAGR